MIVIWNSILRFERRVHNSLPDPVERWQLCFAYGDWVTDYLTRRYKNEAPSILEALNRLNCCILQVANSSEPKKCTPKRKRRKKRKKRPK